MIAAIAYADKKFECAEHLLGRSCLKNGADIFYGYSPKDLPDELRNRCVEKRGGGYWRWKSYILCDALSKLKDGDYLAYFDSGCILTGDIHQLISCMERDDQDLMLFAQSSDFSERKWTKRDIFISFNCDDRSDILDTPQTYSGFIICRNTPQIRDFMKQYYEVCNTGSLITDADCTCGLPDHTGFIENRHDQSILSVMAKMKGVHPYRDPSQYSESGKYSEDIIERSTYPTMIYCHRKGFVRYLWQLRLVESAFYKEKLPKCRLVYKAVNYVIYKVILRKYM